MSTRVLGLVVAVTAASLAPASAKPQTPPASGSVVGGATAGAKSGAVPRTPWGDPDLQGVWDYRTITPLERPRDLGDRQFLTDEEKSALEARAAARLDQAPEKHPRVITNHAPYWLDPGRFVLEDRRTSLIVDPPDGRMPPLTPEAQARLRLRRAVADLLGPGADGPEDRSLMERCISYGFPTNILPGGYNNNNIHIVQTPAYAGIVHEMVHEVRIIPVDGRPHLTAVIRPLIGDSRGRWEGETLVVETTNFSGRTAWHGASQWLWQTVGATFRVVERFTRVDAGSLGYEITVEDPSTWVEPWTAAYPMRQSDGPLLEYACHEANYSMRNILEVARDLDKAGAHVGP